MNVTLPDGTVITNVPDDITQEQLDQKLQANGIDVSKFKPTLGQEVLRATSPVVLVYEVVNKCCFESLRQSPFFSSS